MRFFSSTLSLLAAVASATILQNGQVRDMVFPDTTIASVASDRSWRTYGPSASEISYKEDGTASTSHGGREYSSISLDTAYRRLKREIRAPGLKFGFIGDKVAISFGNYTSPGVLVAYRLDGQDWMFTNVTANSTHQFISSTTTGFNLTTHAQLPQTLELRVTNWAYGVQITGVHVSSSSKLIKLPNYSKTIEIIGDSLSAGQYATYEGISSYAWGLGAGFGNVEFFITAYPGICLVDTNCWGNPRGQTYQWYHASDTSSRAVEIYDDNPEVWDFRKHPAADIVVINLGTNDNNTHNNVTNEKYLQSYLEFVQGVHQVYPHAQIILVSLWNGFSPVGNSYAQGGAFIEEIEEVYNHYKHTGFVHYFNTTGIMQHNDIGPQYHPTDVGHVKVASHLMQYIKLNFGWELGATGPEVQHDTLYWNDQQNY